jgi:hypothetical protein
VHDGSDRFGNVAFEGGAECGQVQVTVDAAELVAGLDHPGRAPAQRHLPVAPALDVGGVLAAHRDHRLDAVRRAQRAGEGGRHTKAQHREGLAQALAQAGRRAWVGAFQQFMTRLYGVLIGDVGDEARLRAAMSCGAIGVAVIHPLVADLDDNTLCTYLLRHARRLIR